MSAFVFNILAGMRADDVSLKKLGNFSLPKFKDSLIEEFKSRFDKIIIFYDSDEPGRKFSAKLSISLYAR